MIPPPHSPSSTLHAPGVAEQSIKRETIAFRPKVELSPKTQELFGTPPAMTGTDYLPAETLARAQKGSFLEKVSQ